MRDWARGRAPTEQVAAAYRCVLDRAGDAAGASHWEKFLLSGGRFDDLLRRFAMSPEFGQRMEAHRLPAVHAEHREALPDVQAVYRCLLSRDPDPEGEAHWEAYLRRGGSLEGMLLGFIGSPEFLRRLNASSIATVPTAAPGASPRRIAVIGNAQSVAMTRCLQALTGHDMPALIWTEAERLLETEDARARVAEVFRVHERVFIQPAHWGILSKRHPEFEAQVILYPDVTFMAYHPDVVHVRQVKTGINLIGPCHDYQSSIAFLGWKAGLSAAQTVDLFSPEVFSRLGFSNCWESSLDALIEQGRAARMDLHDLVASWRRRGSFMRSMDRAKPYVSLDIAKALLDQNGFSTVRFDVEPYVYDWLGMGAAWPVYPEIGRHLGIEGNYAFKLASPHLQPDQPLRTIGLEEFVSESFAVFARYTPGELECDRLRTAPYQRILDELRLRAKNASERGPDGEIPAATPRPQLPAAVPSFAVLGNSQAGSMARCLQALAGGPMPYAESVSAARLAEWASGEASLVSLFSGVERIFLQPWIWTALAPRYARFESKVVLYPVIAFMAYQPDLVNLRIRTSGVLMTDGPLGPCHSSIAFLGWYGGLNVAQTAALFRRDVMQRLGHLDCWRSAEYALLEEGRSAGVSLVELLERWKAGGCFMHQPNHPKLHVMADLARLLLERLEIPVASIQLAEFAHDPLADEAAWPVYPDLAKTLGGFPSHDFKKPLAGKVDFSDVRVISLVEFVEEAFAAFDRFQRGDLVCHRLEWSSYIELLGQLEGSRSPLPTRPTRPTQKPAAAIPTTAEVPSAPLQARRSHPYAGLPSHCFWRKAVGEVSPSDIDPVLKTKFPIGKDTRVATAGSCFALHISQRLRERDFNFVQTESGPDVMGPSAEDEGTSGAFSARFGYVYTARQLRQLMERAYGRFSPRDSAWQNDEGRWVDPFRPSIEAGGFATIEDFDGARSRHLSAVRQMFEMVDVFVFTLGLTEAWRARSDGAVFPLAPGVAGGEMDAERYEFVNFSVAEVDDDLQAFIDGLRLVNPLARVILTVSPVPLVATYLDRHVLVSTTYSKSVLRVAAEQIADRNACCDYFPSYEIITGNFSRGHYFGKDLRSVDPSGVNHVMRLFFQHYAGEPASPVLPALEQVETALDAEMLARAWKDIPTVCDESLLDAAGR